MPYMPADLLAQLDTFIAIAPDERTRELRIVIRAYFTDEAKRAAVVRESHKALDVLAPEVAS